MTGSRRYRLLSEEEVELWRAVAQTVAPRPGSSLPAALRVDAVPAKSEPAPGLPSKQRLFDVPAYVPPQSQARATSSPSLAPLEPKYRKKLARGQIGIERALDLHGLNQAEAHAALRAFLRLAHDQNLRLVLVVTGKGHRAQLSHDGFSDGGILRRSVPHWLREADLRTVVLGFEEASQPHGGAGALYVRMRQRRM